MEKRMFSIRMKAVRAVNKMRGVDVKEMKRLRFAIGVTSGSMAICLGVSYMKYFGWESEYSPMPSAQYEKALAYLEMRLNQQQRTAKDAERNIGNRLNRDESGEKINV